MGASGACVMCSKCRKHVTEGQDEWRLWTRSREEPDDADPVKDFGLNPKINQKPLKKFKHLIESDL